MSASWKALAMYPAFTAGPLGAAFNASARSFICALSSCVSSLSVLSSLRAPPYTAVAVWQLHRKVFSQRGHLSDCRWVAASKRGGERGKRESETLP